jgi:hypothetical protein
MEHAHLNLSTFHQRLDLGVSNVTQEITLNTFAYMRFHIYRGTRIQTYIAEMSTEHVHPLDVKGPKWQTITIHQEEFFLHFLN